jgi:ATP-dependent DNA helicase Rep
VLSKLNDPQREAVKYLNGPLLVLAGAGSGKTRVITHKIAHLIEQHGYDPKHIAAITFTNKAAREMQERVSELLQGKPSKGLTVTTFHSLGLQILRSEAQLLGYKPRFSILDAADSFKVIADILATTDKQLLKRTQWRISQWKNEFISADQALRQAEEESDHASAKVYQLYQQALRAYQSVDFDDLIRLPVELFEQHRDILHKWQLKLRYLLIDEYQDTNACQYRLVKQLTGSEGMFTAVGDDDQAIYAWRGADVENLRQLTTDFPNLHLIKLEQNYRSTVRILRAANTLIANNPKLFEKKLWSDLGIGDLIQVSPTKDEEHEAEMVAMKLLAHKFEYRTRWSDYAVLYRGNHQSRLIEQQLRSQKIPYTVSGGQSFFDRAEIKDLVSYLRLIANEDDDPAFIRAAATPKKGIGSTTLERLGEYAAGRHISLFEAAYEPAFQRDMGKKQLADLIAFCDFISRIQQRAAKDPAGELLQDLLNAIQYETFLYDSEEPRAAEAKWGNVMDFIGWMTRKGETEDSNLLQLTQTVALMSMLEGREDGEPDAVKLSTLHAAKGLEFGHVFLIGVEEGILPHHSSTVAGVDAARVEEERRLMYVGITRAQRSLTITYCKKRRRNGDWEQSEPSRFLDELPVDDLQHAGKVSTSDPQQRKAQQASRMANIRAILGK